MINARPNLNGNTSQDFSKAAQELQDASKVLETALANAYGSVFHGRNYQTFNDAANARIEDTNSFGDMLDMVRDIRQYALAINRAGNS